ncbi:hypothetical protein ACVWYU_002711 [Pseudomonas sp. TE12234]
MAGQASHEELDAAQSRPVDSVPPGRMASAKARALVEHVLGLLRKTLLNFDYFVY